MTRYELLDRIGVGGMAEIFRGKAVAAGGFEKPVAIKRILPHLSQDRRFVELLIAEAKVLSLLKHRNIVQIFDVGLGDDGQYFLVMEFVDGKDLGAVQRGLEARRRRIPFDLVLHIGAEICEALEHAHVARAPDGKPMSLVHRDVSPSNVLLSRAGEVKLTDFGIAKRAEQDPTQAGAVRGKFAYISPEQAKNEHLDPRSDVFSVGILMWELVCNRRLFSGLDDLAALRAVREANVPRPSEIDRTLSPEIDAILMSALSRDKVRRFPTAGALGQKLRSLRYSLDETVGDPATELARIIESTEEVERQSQQIIAMRPSMSGMFDGAEATVIRIHTADEFSARDNDASIVKAREVIDRFEEEETRLAKLSDDQMRILRTARSRDSLEADELTAHAEPVRLPGMPRARRPSDEATRARAPISDDDETVATPAGDTPPIGADEPTRLVAPRDKRTPPSASPRAQRPSTVPPPMPMPMRAAPPVHHAEPAMPLPASSGGALPGYAPWTQHAPPPLAPQQIVPQHPPREATPTANDAFAPPVYAPRPSLPQVAGFQTPGSPGKAAMQPWILVLGALVVAGLAFLLTRMFIR